MKFLLDMGLAQSTAAFLRTQSHDAVHLREDGLQRLGDEQIVEKAQREGRVILTHDLGFGQIIALSRRQLPSVITFRLDNMQPAQVNHYLTEVLARFTAELQVGVLVSVHEKAIRVRSLPIGGPTP
jgi:predicted nuclease of predicted toxin-antitoxin system